jgi:fatty-acyl-CoA synthase
VAYVIPRDGLTVDASALRAYLEGQLARFKMPREIVFVDTLPRTALGKVQHYLLRKAR